MSPEDPIAEDGDASAGGSSLQREEPEVVSGAALASPIDTRDTLSSIDLDDGLIEISGDADLVLRVEYMEDHVAMRYIRCLQVGFVLSVIVLILEAIWVQSDYTSSATGRRILILNIVMFCLAVLAHALFWWIPLEEYGFL